MNEYVPITCVQCSRTLRVRLEYIGHQVECVHCRWTFLATSRDPQVLQYLLQRGPATGDAEQLEQFLAELEQIRRQSDEDRTVLTNEIDRLRTQAAAAQAELAVSVQQVESLALERDRLAAERSTMEHDRRDADQREQQWRKRLDDALAEIEIERQRHAEALSRLERALNEQRLDLQRKIDELAEQQGLLQQQHKAASEQLDTVRTEREELLASLEQAEQDRNDAARAWQEERSRLADTFQATRRRHEAAVRQNSALSSRIEALRSELAQQRDRERQHHETVASLQLEIEAAQQKVAQVESALESERRCAEEDSRRQEHRHATLEQQFDRERQAIARELRDARQRASNIEQELLTIQRKHGEALQERDQALKRCDLLDENRLNIERQWQATLAQLNQAVLQAQRQDELSRQQQDSLARQIQTLAAQLDQVRTREKRLEEDLATAKRDVELALDYADAERREAIDELARAQTCHGNAREAWEEERASLEQQFSKEQQRLQMELDRLNAVAARLRDEQETLYRQIEVIEQDRTRLIADADEVQRASHTQQRAVVKIARLTRSLQRAWQQIELLRDRNQELLARQRGTPPHDDAPLRQQHVRNMAPQ